LKERYKQTDKQTESTTKNSRLLAGAESIILTKTIVFTMVMVKPNNNITKCLKGTAS